MTTEPRQEAERMLAPFGVMPSRQEYQQFKTVDSYNAARDRLVDVLAAAIEVDRGGDAYLEQLSVALSVLREDET